MNKELDMLKKTVTAFEKYISKTVREYGESRMFDCGVQDARKVIEQAKKIRADKKPLTGIPHNTTTVLGRTSRVMLPHEKGCCVQLTRIGTGRVVIFRRLEGSGVGDG